VELGIDGKVAVVSGASRGIGRAIAKRLVEEGALVVMAARRAPDLESAGAEIDAGRSGRIATVVADMTDLADVARVIDVAHERFGLVQIAISNVIGHVIDVDVDVEGEGPGAGTFSGLPASEYRQEFSHLLVSAWALASACIPDMKAERWGRIMNIGSGVAREPTKDLPHVLPNTVRPAVAALYRSLARDLAPDGITVNNILTGSILTERNRSYWRWLAAERGQTVEEVTSGVTGGIPVRRMGEPEEMAALVGFLASTLASSITGQSIPVDGGINRHV
jgi:3-oxoacyl-[acyl-carrier protein] reductase